MHDQLFAGYQALNLPDLEGYAGSLGLNLPQFKECLESGQAKSKVENNMAEGAKAGVNSTPYFLLGLTKPESSEVKVLMVLRGAHPFKSFKQAIDRLLTANP